MKSSMNMIVGAAVGAGLMYLLDPSEGRTRRSMMKDKVTKAKNETRDYVDSKSRHLSNRMDGMKHEIGDAVGAGNSQF